MEISLPKDLYELELKCRHRTCIKEIIFFGTGTSSCVPNFYCLKERGTGCKVCETGYRDPWNSGNKRRNTSICFRVLEEEEDEAEAKGKEQENEKLDHRKKDGQKKYRNYIVDAGKTFYESVLQWWPFYGIQGTLDGLLITHSHADAILGLDDLRNFTAPPGKGRKQVQPHVTVHLSQDSMNYVSGAFPYLVSREMATGGGDVSSIRYEIFNDNCKPELESFNLYKFDIKDENDHASNDKNGNANVIDGSIILKEAKMNKVAVTPLPVYHGSLSDDSPFVAHGFLLGEGIAYISDANALTEWTSQHLLNRSSGRPLDLLVLDCLRGCGTSHKSHMCLDQALETVKLLEPTLTLLTGISHSLDHHGTNNGPLADFTRETGLKVKLAMDGLKISLSS